MKNIHGILYNFLIISLCFCIIFLIPLVKVYAQDGSYSAEAQKFLDTNSDGDLDVFKFSINNILNSDGNIVEKPTGNPSIFGRTDYGSEFFLENELSTTFSIEIPAFVIDDLALDPSGEYFPVIRDGAQELNIDFKELYDTKNGEVITPEMGFVRLINDATSSNQENLSDGEIVEFFIRPSNNYLTRHNGDNLFFIDRPIPENPVVTNVDSDKTEYKTSSSSDEDEITSVYVPAPASKFEPTQIVMPVLTDGDYNYNIEPAAAETFSDDVQVVAIPEGEAEVISKKVKEITRKKKASSTPKHDKDMPPALDPEIEAMMSLQILLNNVTKAPNNLISEARRKIEKAFPNMSKELINLFINTVNPDEKFNLIQYPKKFMDNELAKLSDSTEINLLLGKDIPKKDLTKIYNLILYKFSSELADLGFDTLRNQRSDFYDNIKKADQILEQVQLQRDILPLASLLGSDEDKKDLSTLLIAPIKINPDSSTKLFEASSSQKVLGQMKQFSDIINSINSSFNSINTVGSISDDSIPIVEINVQIGESITDTLKNKLNEDKRLNRNFQTRSQSSKLNKFDFEIPIQDKSSNPSASLPLLAETPNITEQELQLVAETAEATNNILNQIISRMLVELEDASANESFTGLAPAVTDDNRIFQANQEIREDFVFTNALSSAQRLQEIEDIRAIFQILGIGS